MLNTHIIILGYMGCGKSTIAKKLSSVLGFCHVDLDKQIELSTKMSISDFFNINGEIEFRKIEKKLLEKSLKSKTQTIISLGGGTPCYYDNMDFILKVSNNVFFINTSLDELTDRLFKEKDSRPLIKSFQSKDSLKEFVAKHLFERIVYYKLSNHTIKDENKSLDDLCDEIISKII